MIETRFRGRNQVESECYGYSTELEVIPNLYLSNEIFTQINIYKLYNLYKRQYILSHNL